MNERIRELINEATCFKEGDTEGKYDIEVFDKEKFAELIVRECAHMAESFHHHQYDFTGNLELAKKIRLKPSRRIEFLNAKIDCRLLEYELYAGSKRIDKVVEKP